MAYIANHPDYDKTIDDVKLVRHAIEGEAAVKRESTTYLPHPSMLDKDTQQAKDRYKAYIGRAEFDNVAGQTEIELMGAFKNSAHEIDLPSQVAYLLDDSDGDALSLSDAINLTANNCLEVKFHLLLAEFEDGGIEDGQQITVAEKARLNQRAKIVHYPRETLTNWEFSKVNGRIQLSKACLTTEHIELDDNFKEKKYIKHLILSLDENGFYRQKLVKTQQGEAVEEGEWIYPKALGKTMDYIPIEIAIDSKMIVGELPRQCGYLEPIARKDIHRYQVNADLKEKLAILQDTINTFGWTAQSWEEFKQINQRDYVATGVAVANQFPRDVTVDVMKLTTDGDAHFRYIELNEKQTKALGGRLGDEVTDQTATEARIRSARENAILTSIAESCEQAFRKVVSYCCEFEGLKINHNDIKINVNREFSSTEITPEQVRSLIEAKDGGLISKKTAAKLAKEGGLSDPEETLDEALEAIESEMPDPIDVNDEDADNGNPQQVAA